MSDGHVLGIWLIGLTGLMAGFTASSPATLVSDTEEEFRVPIRGRKKSRSLTLIERSSVVEKADTQPFFHFNERKEHQSYCNQQNNVECRKGGGAEDMAHEG